MHRGPAHCSCFHGSNAFQMLSSTTSTKNAICTAISTVLGLAHTGYHTGKEPVSTHYQLRAEASLHCSRNMRPSCNKSKFRWHCYCPVLRRKKNVKMVVSQNKGKPNIDPNILYSLLWRQMVPLILGTAHIHLIRGLSLGSL